METPTNTPKATPKLTEEVVAEVTENIAEAVEAAEDVAEDVAPNSEPKLEADTTANTPSKKLLDRLNIGAVHHIWHDLKPRIISALIMLAVFLFSVTMGGILFTAIVTAIALLMIREWDFLVAHKPARWGWYGIAYITATAASIIWLRNISTIENPHMGMGLVVFLAAIVMATDICAYSVGRKFGKHKLAPDISPGKTWEGLLGGIIGAAIIGLIFSSLTPVPDTTFKTVILAMLLACIAQIGDLFESQLKREADVKDSGSLIKGHGGVLDRLDGMLTAAPVFALTILIVGLD